MAFDGRITWEEIGMTTVNDAKMIKLELETGTTGDIKDLEFLWLQDKIIGPTEDFETINDLWGLYMDELGYKDLGSLDDKQFNWLGDLGYTGDINDRWLEFWNDI